MRSHALALTIALCAPGLLHAAPDAPVCTGKRGAAGTFHLTLTSGGIERTYRLDVPAENNPNVGAPVIFNFHGLGGDGEGQANGTDLPEVAGAAGYITVHPDGYESSWNAGSCCGQAAIDRIDDVQFVRDMIAALSVDYCLDPARIHATGFSNGGYFSHRLGCEAFDIVASIAPVSGLVGVPCAPDRPVAVHQSHGTADALVFYNRGVEDIEAWAEIDGCRQGPTVYYDKGNITCEQWSECADGTVVELCSERFTGHTWVDSRFYSATDAAVEFFDAHPMP